MARTREFYRRREDNDPLRLLQVNQLAQQVIELTSPCWRDISQSRGVEVEIQTHFEESLPELYGNESELREALTNIVLNALDALPKGGRITLSTRAVRLPNPPSSGQKPTHLILEVADNGIGMDDSDASAVPGTVLLHQTRAWRLRLGLGHGLWSGGAA